MMMMMMKALGSSRSFSLVGVLGSEQWRSVSNFPGLGGLLAAAETSLRSTSWHFFCFCCYRIGKVKILSRVPRLRCLGRVTFSWIFCLGPGQTMMDDRGRLLDIIISDDGNWSCFGTEW